MFPVSPVIFVEPKFDNGIFRKTCFRRNDSIWRTFFSFFILENFQCTCYLTTIANCGENAGTPDWTWLPYLILISMLPICTRKPQRIWVITFLWFLVILDCELMGTLHLSEGILWGLGWGLHLPEKIWVSFCRFLSTSKLTTFLSVRFTEPQVRYMIILKLRGYSFEFLGTHTHPKPKAHPFTQVPSFKQKTPFQLLYRGYIRLFFFFF